MGRDEEKQPIWNRRMLDFALRAGFEIRLCQPYRAQTKGKVESAVKYVKGNMWPSMRFTCDAGLNWQALEWCGGVANRRIHGTTHRIPWEMLMEERPRPGKLPGRGRAGATFAGGPQGGPGRFRQLGGLPLRNALEVGWSRRAGGTASGDGGDLSRR